MRIRGSRSITKNESPSIEMLHKVDETLTSSNSETTTEETTQTDQIHGECNFTCKTCNKGFPSFQALGGHMTGHNKKKLLSPEPSKRLVKPKMHSCVICGAEFSLGQSLGGHMRKHRALHVNSALKRESSSSTSSASEAVPVINRREPLGIDLNLMPSE